MLLIVFRVRHVFRIGCLRLCATLIFALPSETSAHGSKGGIEVAAGVVWVQSDLSYDIENRTNARDTGRGMECLEHRWVQITFG